VQFHSLKLRFRRLFRKRKRQVERLGSQAESQLEMNFVRRLGNLVPVRRFVAVWLLLAVLLIGGVIAETRALTSYYQTLQPAPGGIYSEGIVGNFTNANPLYATDRVNNAVSKLLFAGLFKYDAKNNLVGDLAENWQVDKTGQNYTVHLRPNLTWQDGQPLTAADVVFTYQTIQNPDAQSPLNVSWQNVEVSAADDHTVLFRLPNPLASFPDSLTTGIVPQHILSKVDYPDMRSTSFNTTNPVGAGPFELKKIQVEGNSPTTREEEIALQPFERYHGGAPKLANFVIHSFPDDKTMIKSFRDQSITAMAGYQNAPKGVTKAKNVHEYNLPLAAANMVFFKTTSGVLSDKIVRQALVGGADTDQIVQAVGEHLVPVREPLLRGQVGYDPALAQLHTDVASANAVLEKDGWKLQTNGIRAKKGQPLAFKLFAQNTDEYRKTTDLLKRQWRQLGADVQVTLQTANDLQPTVAYHTYDALLYGISIGADPDVFVYWDSTQADVRSASRLNFSEYKSTTADAALEAGRTRTTAALRAIKYQSFLKAWREDAPALGLYQPQITYATHGKVYNFDDRLLTTDTDRFNNVSDWMIRTVRKDTH
jgi:peptide/nickel transport system substrate-binding protein